MNLEWLAAEYGLAGVVYGVFSEWADWRGLREPVRSEDRHWIREQFTRYTHTHCPELAQALFVDKTGAYNRGTGFYWDGRRKPRQQVESDEESS